MERYYEAIDLLKGMISRPSFSRDETAVADFLQATCGSSPRISISVNRPFYSTPI